MQQAAAQRWTLQWQCIEQGGTHRWCAREMQLGDALCVAWLMQGKGLWRSHFYVSCACALLPQMVRDALASTVRSSSVWQAASGLLAAGGGKAVAYVAAKVAKAITSGQHAAVLCCAHVLLCVCVVRTINHVHTALSPPWPQRRRLSRAAAPSYWAMRCLLVGHLTADL